MGWLWLSLGGCDSVTVVGASFLSSVVFSSLLYLLGLPLIVVDLKSMHLVPSSLVMISLHSAWVLAITLYSAAGASPWSC